MCQMINYAFIFARGGSKGLPGKNIRPLAGKPLIQYSIDVAKKCELISKVFVSTDDTEIASIAGNLGVEVIKRPSELASDIAPEWMAWRHAIDYVSNKYGRFDNFISLPATSPLRTVEDIVNAVSQLEVSQADICIGITPASRSPYFNMVRFNKNNYLSLVNEPKTEFVRRQDAPEVYDITTIIYVSTPDFILNNYGLFSGNLTSIVVPKERAVDIDDIYDFMFAETLLNVKR